MNTAKNTRKKRQSSNFTTVRAESLVVEWANISTDYPVEVTHPLSETTKAAIARTDAAVLRLFRRYPEVFSSFPVVEESQCKKESNVATTHWWIVATIQRFLRKAWDAPDMRAREWHLSSARRDFHSSTVWMPMWEERMRKSPDIKRAIAEGLTPAEEAAKLSVPALSAFEQALYHLQRVASRMRHCRNEKCPAPYFLVQKKGQKYCSSECSAPMQREQKKKWWREHRAKHSK